ncbi:MAG: hypothetical protein V1809_01915 [Planctomycetota bacterium]
MFPNAGYPAPSPAADAGQQYGADGMLYENGTTGGLRHTVQRLEDSPSMASDGADYESIYCMDTVVTTGQSTIGHGEYCGIYPCLEGHWFNLIAFRPFVFSCWVKCSKVGKRHVNFRDGHKANSFTVPYTIKTANRWQKVVAKVPALPSALYRGDRHSGIGMILSFPLVSGPAFQANVFNRWVSGNGVYGADMVQLNSVGDDFRIAQLMIVPGTAVVPFQEVAVRPYEYLEARARYWKTYEEDVEPGTPSINGAVIVRDPGGTKPVAVTIPLPFQMRSNPSVVFHNPAAANALWRNLTDNADSVAPGIIYARSGAIAFEKGVRSADSGDRLGIHFELDSDIY